MTDARINTSTEITCKFKTTKRKPWALKIMLALGQSHFPKSLNLAFVQKMIKSWGLESGTVVSHRLNLFLNKYSHRQQKCKIRVRCSRDNRT